MNWPLQWSPFKPQPWREKTLLLFYLQVRLIWDLYDSCLQITTCVSKIMSLINHIHVKNKIPCLDVATIMFVHIRTCTNDITCSFEAGSSYSFWGHLKGYFLTSTFVEAYCAYWSLYGVNVVPNSIFCSLFLCVCMCVTLILEKVGWGRCIFKYCFMTSWRHWIAPLGHRVWLRVHWASFWKNDLSLKG